MASRFGYRSGVEFERNVYGWLRGASRVEAGVLTQRDGAMDPTEVAEALNDALREVYMRAAEGCQNGNSERISDYWDFTYPASAEYVGIGKAGQKPGAVSMDPMLPRPWLDIVALYDRRLRGPTKQIPNVDFDKMSSTYGVRWAYKHDAIYITDRNITVGPGRSYSIRMHYIPQPEPIDIANEDAREDIPLELHAPIEVCAAFRMAAKIRSEETAMLNQQYERDMAIAAQSLGRAIDQPQYIRTARFQRR